MDFRNNRGVLPGEGGVGGVAGVGWGGVGAGVVREGLVVVKF